MQNGTKLNSEGWNDSGKTKIPNSADYWVTFVAW